MKSQNLVCFFPYPLLVVVVHFMRGCKIDLIFFLIPRDDTLAFFPIPPMYVPFIIIIFYLCWVLKNREKKSEKGKVGENVKEVRNKTLLSK